MTSSTTSTTSPPLQTRSFLASLDTRRLISALLFIMIFAISTRIPVDTDTWWHVRSGEWMLANGQILMQDPFSFTRYEQAWINHSWGSQLLMVLFYRALGDAGLALYTAILATVGMFIVYLICEGNAYVRSFILVMAAAAAAVFWSARPQMTSFLLSALTLYFLHLYKRKHVDRLWLLPLLMILWVNLHGGFAIGFIVLFGTIAGEILGRLFDSANPDVLSWRQIGKLALITVLCAVALVVNPNTVQMWGYPFRTFGIGVLQQFIQEWSSPNFHGRETWPFIFLLLGTLAAVGLGSKRIDWTDLVLTSGTAFMSLYAGRNIATFAIVAAPVLTRHLHALLEERGLRLGRPRSPRGAMLLLNYALLLLVITGALLYVIGVLIPRSVAQAQAEYLPVEAADYLNSSLDPAQTGNMFNSYNWGGYLLFAAPQFRVFVDGRTDLYDDELLREWIDAATGKNWQFIFEKWQIGLVVIEKESALAGLLRGDSTWREVHTDDKAAIFTRSTTS